MQGAFAAALVIDEVRLAAGEHDVARLKVAVEKVVAVGAQEKFGEALEIVFKRLFVKRNSGEAEKIVFEIVEVPDDGLAIKTAAWIADAVIQIAAGFDLKFREDFDDFAVRIGNFGSDCGSGAIFGKKFEQRRVA